MVRRIRVLIVDDEPPARTRLRRLLAGEEGVDLVDECETGSDAIASIERDTPDLVFLDVKMPGLDGFHVIEALDVARLPAIVFVTGFDEYAVHAFEVHAVDYLLKPVGRERFQTALARARERLALGDSTAPDPRLLALVAELRAARSRRERLAVKHEGRVQFVRIGDLDWVEASANYVRLHAHGAVYVLRESMKSMEARLPADSFLRIHRSTIVNFDRVREIQPWFHGEYIALLSDGTKLVVSHAYADRLRELIG
ncbi:MAG TPA: LytTR family DNA-binding domain-containing protein [Gemmatimonadaceae bacterium]|nr:LytTR family DNA-binding domain-containing protein [Gemmatimonadaceae bacterium]